MYDYANLLFTGKNCNARCYKCIGNHPDLRCLPWNLDLFPPKNIELLIEKVNKYKIKDFAFTGTNVDPQLYKYESELISFVRERLKTDSNLSLHTNGLLALRKLAVFNSYDKASISFPSFNLETYVKVTCVRPPDIKKIIQEATVPIKLSMLITPFNKEEIDSYVKQSRDLGITRVVVRKLKSYEDEYPLEMMGPFKNNTPIKTIFGWPIYKIHDVEVTICSFDKSSARGIFLFSDGRLEDKLV